MRIQRGPLVALRSVLLVSCILGAAAGCRDDREPATSDLDHGRKLFRHHCAACHGARGEGGPLPSAGEAIVARDLSDPRFQSERTDDQLLAALDHGKARNMPAFEDRLSSQEKLALVRYVRELGKDAKPTSALSQSASERAHQPSNDQRTQ